MPIKNLILNMRVDRGRQTRKFVALVNINFLLSNILILSILFYLIVDAHIISESRILVLQIPLEIKSEEVRISACQSEFLPPISKR